MSDLITTTSRAPLLHTLPVPCAPISVRAGTREDIPFIDALQKQYRKALGFFPRAQLEGYIDNGWVLIAEGVSSPSSVVSSEEDATSAATDYGPLTTDSRLGYVASRDRYLKRDELGVIYQLCVSPTAQRGLIGATLIKSVFERSAYGCRLYCCWCAQDLAANKFWESLGFLPIAFRGGSSKKARVHIFWQKRIRANDASTPWWFPAKTEGGAMREDRIALPIPQGLVWSDPMPVLVASAEPGTKSGEKRTREKLLPARKSSPPASVPPPPAGMLFGPPSATAIVEEQLPAPIEPAKAKHERPKREPSTIEWSAASKIDPKLIAAARELRDRYLERVNAEAFAVTSGKYDVSRTLSAVEASRTIDPSSERLPPITVEVVSPKLLVA